MIFFKKSSAKNEGPLVSTDARLPGVWRESRKRKRTWYNLVVMEINFLSILFYFQTLRMQVNYCCRLRGGLGGTYCDIVDFAGPGVCKGNDVRRNVIKFSRSRDFVTNLTKNLKIYAAAFCTDYDSFIPSIYYAITNVISFYGRQKSQSQSKKWIHNPFLFLMVINCRCDWSISDSFSVFNQDPAEKALISDWSASSFILIV